MISFVYINTSIDTFSLDVYSYLYNSEAEAGAEARRPGGGRERLGLGRRAP